MMEQLLDETIDTRGLLDVLINKIKKQYKIKYKYVYNIDRYIWDKFQKDSEPIISSSELQDNQIYTPYGVYIGDYFTIVSTKLHDDICRILFTEDIKRFNKEHIDLNISVKTGLYDLGYVGNQTLLIPKPTKDETPIFSSNIVDELINEILSFTNNQSKYEELDMIHKRGFLLYGMPGNGKTTLIKHIVNQLDAISIVCNVQQESHLNFITTFLKDNKYDDTLKIIIMEDIDGFNTYYRSELLNLLDGLSNYKNVVFLATTNYPSKLDLGLVNRPSRFDKFIYIDKPDELGRSLLLDKYFKLKKTQKQKLIEVTDDFPASYFKELYILTTLLNIDICMAFKEIKRRIGIYKTVNTLSD